MSVEIKAVFQRGEEKRRGERRRGEAFRGIKRGNIYPLKPRTNGG
jgi:hypothetical protein